MEPHDHTLQGFALPHDGAVPEPGPRRPGDLSVQPVSGHRRVTGGRLQLRLQLTWAHTRTVSNQPAVLYRMIDELIQADLAVRAGEHLLKVEPVDAAVAVHISATWLAGCPISDGATGRDSGASSTRSTTPSLSCSSGSTGTATAPSLAGIECHASDPFANRPGRGVFGATSGRTMRFVAARSVNAGPISAVVLE